MRKKLVHECVLFGTILVIYFQLHSTRITIGGMVLYHIKIFFGVNFLTDYIRRYILLMVKGFQTIFEQ